MKYVILGCLKTTSFVLLRFKCKQFAAAQALMRLNSTSNSVSVCSGTSNVVSSAYLNTSFNSDRAQRSMVLTVTADMSVRIIQLTMVVVVLLSAKFCHLQMSSIVYVDINCSKVRVRVEIRVGMCH